MTSTESAINQAQDLAGLTKNKDEPDEQTQLVAAVMSELEPPAEEKQVAAAGSSTEKMPAWLSTDIELTEIILSEEKFSINSKFCVFWKDDQGQFSRLIDEETMNKINAKGSVSRKDLSVAVKKKLPLKLGFLLNAVDMKIVKCYLELHDADARVWKLYVRFEATLSEHFELSAFPFDSQFLNLQIAYRLQMYHFLHDCPDWMMVDQHAQFKLDLPVKFSTADSVKTKWTPHAPWLDFRGKRKDFDFHFSVIRLRVRRDPSFWLVNGVLPIFLVLACAFAQVVMPFDEFIGDKLSFLITLLLTTAAFQYALSTDMPKSGESTMIDTYILLDYFILSCLVFQTAVLYHVDTTGDTSDVKVVEYVVCAIFAVIWLFFTARFVWGYWQFRQGTVDWKSLSERELTIWAKETQGDTKFLKVDKTHFHTTNDE